MEISILDSDVNMFKPLGLIVFLLAIVACAQNNDEDRSGSASTDETVRKSEEIAAVVPASDAEVSGTPAYKRKRETVSIGEDEHPRPETTLETLAKLKPILSKSDPVATVTAGNASGQNDGAAACIVTTRQIAEQHGLNCQLKMNAWALSGVEPSRMGIGPVSASKAALNRAQLKLSDIDLLELNEAFAAQVLACTQEWNFSKEDFERLNVNGSGIALGHPVGATGARILATLAHELDRRDAQYGLETMCIGGGQGLAAVFERVTS